MAEWTRPASVPYPQTYSQFNGKNKDGKNRAYWIQDLTEEYFEDVIQHYVTGFWTDEPLNKALGSKDDSLCIKEMSMFLNIVLNSKMSVICLTKDENGSIKIAGFNILLISEKIEPKLELESITLKRAYAINNFFSKRKNVFEEFNCDKYLTALGLFVLPEFRGEGLATKILSVREVIGKLVGVKVTLTLFTTPASQYPAEKVGFKEFVTCSYAEMGKIDKFLEIPEIEKYSKIGKYMYKLCE